MLKIQLQYKLCSAILITLLFSKVSYASLIEHHGYTLNTDTGVVAGGGLEWLRWDKTLGNSFEQAMLDYTDGNWRIANSNDVSVLLEAFEDKNKNIDTLAFEELFGATSVDDFGDVQLRTSKAFYAHEATSFHADWVSLTTRLYEESVVDQFHMVGSDNSPPNWDISSKSADWGVALVRASVPETASGVLVCFSLLGVLLFRLRTTSDFSSL